MALIRHVGAGSGNIVGNILIPPKSIQQFWLIGCRLRDLMVTDAFVAHICGPASCQPLAKICLFADRKRKKTAVPLPMFPLPEGVGVNAFEWIGCCCLLISLNVFLLTVWIKIADGSLLITQKYTESNLYRSLDEFLAVPILVIDRSDRMGWKFSFSSLFVLQVKRWF